MLDANHPLVVQTTSHTWDGDVQEFNNLPPRIWWKGFYATLVFALCYWLLYPAWPTGGGSYTKGVLNKISYQSKEGTVYAPWSSRALLLHTLQQEEATGHRHEYLQRLASTPLREIADHAELMAFSRSLARPLFGDNCVSCHSARAGTLVNPVGDQSALEHLGQWFFGGELEQIRQVITNGRGSDGHGQLAMPAWKHRLSVAEIQALTVYVQALGEPPHPATKPDKKAAKQ